MLGENVHKKLVVVTTASKEKFLAEIDEQLNPECGKEIRLHNVREVYVVTQGVVDNNQQSPRYGQTVGVTRFFTLLNPDGYSRPLKELFVTPAAWFDVKANDLDIVFRHIIEDAEKQDQEARLREAGIALPQGKLKPVDGAGPRRRH